MTRTPRHDPPQKERTDPFVRAGRSIWSITMTVPQLHPFDSFAVAITKSAVPATTGTQLDEHGKRYRLMGRRVCISRQWDSGAIEFDYVKGSLYRLYTDGRAVPTDSPFG
jgi:hypothetical protein